MNAISDQHRCHASWAARCTPMIALLLACAVQVLGGKNDNKALIEKNLPSLGTKVYFPTAADFGTVSERNVNTSSFQVQEKTWAATLHLRLLFFASNEAPIYLWVQYIRVTSPTPSLFDIVLASGLGRFVDGKSNGELATKPLLVSESSTLDVGGSQRTGALYVLASTSEVPEDGMEVVFLPGSDNQSVPSPKAECLVQEVAWGKKERYSSTLPSGKWKSSTWGEVTGRGAQTR